MLVLAILFVTAWEIYWTYHACWMASKLNDKKKFLFFLVFRFSWSPCNLRAKIGSFPRIDAERSELTPNRRRAQQDDTKSTQNAAKLHQIDAERSFSR